ncbi:hypothetical protein TNCV_3537351 [Trichonephila clavipes]|nr:hypothetical protein TNCV_3537351 [Trichonephila clavipes]
MATSTNKTSAFGVKLIHKCMSKKPLHPEKTDCLGRFMGWWNHWSVLLQNDGVTTLQSMQTIFCGASVKSLVYADKPQTLDHLKDNIRRVIADLRPQMLEKVIENWTSRLDYIRASRGIHMPEIIFKMRQKITDGCRGGEFGRIDVLPLKHTTTQDGPRATNSVFQTYVSVIVVASGSPMQAPGSCTYADCCSSATKTGVHYYRYCSWASMRGDG